MTELFADQALLPDGWARDVTLRWDAATGALAEVAADSEPAGLPRAAGPVVPGMANLHSHAFQRAMAGRAEHRAASTGGGAAGDDSFWTWRETMYALAAAVDPDAARAIAAQLAVECLTRGYTALCEFHYLHNAPDGAAYDDPAAMSRAVIAGLRGAGIAVTHLPVLYAHGGFGDAPLGARQKRFAGTPETILDIAERLRGTHADDPDLAVGLALHSLRAVPPAMAAETAAAFSQTDPSAPIHIHVAEQEKEIADCLAATGARPVALLADHVDLSERWCLVHATHLDTQEVGTIARSGAVAGLCPTTEANLGDGLFPFPAYRAAGGRYGIGSDSHVCRDPVRELALLEYGLRLTERRRNRAADDASPSVGGTLWRGSLAGGAQAAGRRMGALAPGHRADLVVLDGDHPDIAERTGDAILDGWVFAADATPVRAVYVSGRQMVEGGRHADADVIAAAYRATIARLFS